jgi:hypothetical protein
MSESNNDDKPRVFHRTTGRLQREIKPIILNFKERKKNIPRDWRMFKFLKGM